MNNRESLVIATRESPLALWQAEHVQALLLAQHPCLPVELLGMTTRGDQILDSPLAKVGGKGLFVKELETALLDGRADIAVHSCKDMPAELPAGLELMIIDQRETPFDALILPSGDTSENRAVSSLSDLPKSAIVGTSSLRRKCQIMAIRPDIQCRDLRGNVNTRLAKLDAGNYDAIVLAAAGLQRLGMGDRVSLTLPAAELLPAVGQGALAIELRSDDAATRQLIAPLVDRDTVLCVVAERGMNARLEGGCQVPIAGFAQIEDGELLLRGRVGAIDGSQLLARERRLVLRHDATDQHTAKELGRSLADELLDAGADKLLASVLA